MKTKYEILWENTTAGQAEVSKEGLYYLFQCACLPPDQGLYQVIVSGEQGSVNLGTCIPEGSGFAIKTRIPIKKLGEGNLLFRLSSDLPNDKWISLHPEEKFEWLSQVPYGTFQIKNGIPGILLPVI